MTRFRFFLLAALMGFFCHDAKAQFSTTARHIIYASSLPATCSPSTGDVYFKTSATVGMYQCTAVNTWTAVPTSAGALPAGTTVFDAQCYASVSTFGVCTSPAFSSPTVTTQSAGDSTTKTANTAFVTAAISAAIAGVNPAVAVQAATTTAGNTSGLTYLNGVAGIGATFTGVVNTALTVDGYTFTALGQRLLVKSDTQSPSGAFNGVYYVTQVQTAILPLILTRALDYDMPSDINNTGAIPVVNGTANALTSWLLTSNVSTVGTDPLTYTQFSYNPSFQGGICTTTGSSPTLSCAPSISLGSYSNGLTLRIQSNVTSGTGPITINVSSLGAKTIYKKGGLGFIAGGAVPSYDVEAIDANDLQANSEYTLVYSATLNGSAGGFLLLDSSRLESRGAQQLGNYWEVNTTDNAGIQYGWVDTRTDKNASAFSITHIWQPTSNPSNVSQVGLDFLSVWNPNGNNITIPFLTGVSSQLELSAATTGDVVTEGRALFVQTPAFAQAGNPLITTNYGLKIENQAVTGVTTGYAIGTLGGFHYFKGNTTQEGSQNYGADAGASDTYTATITPAPSAYVTGACYLFKANTANAGTASINFNSLGAKTIVHPDGTVLVDGDIVASQDVQVCYDGTNMQLASPSAGALNAIDYTRAWIREEFIGGFPSSTIEGEAGWTLVNHTGTGALTTIAGVASHPGIAHVASGATSGNATSLDLVGSTDAIGTLSTATGVPWRFDFIFQFSATTSVSLYVGCGDGGNPASVANAVGVRFDTSLSDAAFIYRTAAASSVSTQTSSLTPVASTWYHLVMTSTASGTVNFTLNGANAQSIATNVPAVACSPGFRIGTQTSSARNLDADYFLFQQTGLSR